ncbi:MarR family winged helix-turn-helix transcriptional regulator [Undibacterium terreum]|nr:MarR family transcriptional regulator [Undibacterium terreum]
MKPGLGTVLRHLIELLDGAVEAAYKDAGISYRPRYTPVMRVLIRHESATIGQIAEAAGITQPAATQTVALMVKNGLISAKSSADDGRQRLIQLTDKGRELLPRLQASWQATAMAADSLQADLKHPLQQTLEDAITALQVKSYDDRIREARRTLEKESISGQAQHNKSRQAKSPPAKNLRKKA